MTREEEFISKNKSRRIIIEYDYCWRVVLEFEYGKIVALEYPYHMNYDVVWSNSRNTYFATTEIDEDNLPGLEKTLNIAFDEYEKKYGQRD